MARGRGQECVGVPFMVGHDASEGISGQGRCSVRMVIEYIVDLVPNALMWQVEGK
jgi:hypothetical protein